MFKSPTHAVQRMVVPAVLATCLLLRLPAILAESPTAKPAKGSFRIAGTIIDATTLHPLARAQVSVTNTKDPKDAQSLVTSDDGRFQFQVNAGKYSLQGAKHGYIDSAYEQHENFWTGIVTGAGLDTESLVLRLPPTGMLSGKVTDENAEPVRNATISVFRETHSSGIARIQRFNGSTTDDQGTYEIAPIGAGTYFVVATARPWYAVHAPSSPSGSGATDRALDVAYPSSFYKDATEAEDATPIPIARGAHAVVDIQMSAVPALHLVLHGPVAKNQSNLRSPNIGALIQKPMFDGVLQPLLLNGLEQTDPGVFEVTGLAPGRYVVQGGAVTSSGELAPMEMDLSSDGQELDLATGTQGASVRASVSLRGATKLPLHLYLELKDGHGRSVGTSTAADGTEEFDFGGIAPGQYELLAGAAGQALSVAGIAYEGKVTSGHSLNVAAGSQLTIAVTLVGGLVTVEGFAKQSGKPAGGAMIVLVPDNPEANLELFRRDQSDLDGSFALRGVVPGTYTILAITDGWDLDWAKPAVIESYRQHGQKLAVGDQVKGSLHLPAALEVQPKL